LTSAFAAASEAGRGRQGCSLDPEARPAVCLVYACAELKAEISTSEDEQRIRALRSAVHDAFEAFLRAAGEPPDRTPPLGP
jgi:hypothetical protein